MDQFILETTISNTQFNDIHDKFPWVNSRYFDFTLTPQDTSKYSNLQLETIYWDENGKLVRYTTVMHSYEENLSRLHASVRSNLGTVGKGLTGKVIGYADRQVHRVVSRDAPNLGEDIPGTCMMLVPHPHYWNAPNALKHQPIQLTRYWRKKLMTLLMIGKVTAISTELIYEIIYFMFP